MYSVRRRSHHSVKERSLLLHSLKKQKSVGTIIPTNKIFLTSLFKAYRERKHNKWAKQLLKWLRSDSVTKLTSREVLWCILLFLYQMEVAARRNFAVTGGTYLENGYPQLEKELGSWVDNEDLVDAMYNQIGQCGFTSLVGSMMMGGVPDELDFSIIRTILTQVVAKSSKRFHEKSFASHHVIEYIKLVNCKEWGGAHGIRQYLLDSRELQEKKGILVMVVIRQNHAYNLLYNCETKKMGILDWNKIHGDFMVEGEEGFASFSFT